MQMDSEKTQEKLNNYERGAQIGNGCFGSVFMVKRKRDEKQLVWKETNYGRMSDKEKQLLVSEVNILMKFRHPHIVRYYDHIIDREKTTMYIITEFCPNGDLASLIDKCRRERQYIDEEVVWKIILQLALALKECHYRPEGPVLHRDIKPANVFLDSENNVKLGDFGFARVMSSYSMLAETNLGTPFYMSPEQINEHGYNAASDVWALGCLVYEVLTHFRPFEATNQIVLAQKIRMGKFHKLPPQYSPEMNRIVTAMLCVDQTKRPSIEQLLATPALSLRLRERKVNIQYNVLKQREERLKIFEQQLLAKETALNQREQQLTAREAQPPAATARPPPPAAAAATATEAHP